MARFFVGPLVGRITDTTEAFWNSPYYFPVTLAVTAVSLLTGNVVPSTVALALLCGWMLMFCRDILAAATPFLMVFLLSTVKYDSLAVFLPCAPLAVLPIGGLKEKLLAGCWCIFSGGGRPSRWGAAGRGWRRCLLPRCWAAWAPSPPRSTFPPCRCTTPWDWAWGCW